MTDIKTYYLALVIQSNYYPLMRDTNFSTRSYGDMFKEAVKQAKQNKGITNAVIYTNKGTVINLPRKRLEKYF